MIAPPNFFEQIGKLDAAASTLEINVDSNGRGDLNWMLDSEGVFYELTYIGALPPNLLQRIGLRRHREKFRICPGRTISVRELNERIQGLVDQFEEAPNVTDLKAILSGLPQDRILGPRDMFEYLGE